MAKDSTPSLEDQIAALQLENEKLQSDLATARAAQSAPVTVAQKPTDLADYKGKHKELATGAIFGLKVIPEDEAVRGKTHHVKNETHFADYTAEEYRERFDKE